MGTPTFADGEPLDELKGLALPITLQGDLGGPKVSVDLASLAVSVGERKLRERLMKKLGIPEDANEGAPADGAQPQKEDDEKSADPKEQLKKSLFDLLGN